jgi:hypothetical protein
MFNSRLFSTNAQGFEKFLLQIVQAQRFSQPPNLMQRFSPLFIAPNLIAPILFSHQKTSYEVLQWVKW